MRRLVYPSLNTAPRRPDPPHRRLETVTALRPPRHQAATALLAAAAADHRDTTSRGFDCKPHFTSLSEYADHFFTISMLGLFAFVTNKLKT